MITVSLKKSPIGRPKRLRATIKALGLRKINSKIQVDEKNVPLLGMIQRAKCLLHITPKL